ncbi:MAG: hypothetical protein K2O65_02005 [Lachnospiraceae bacterium]|nr:hypothetical protein [Lachnospiraceae bacterium]
MSFIALFFPACISLVIRHKRNDRLEWGVPESIIEYAILVLINVLVSQCIVIYVLGIDGVDMSAFQSFPFFTKYLVISMTIAWLTPYLEEIGRKYISVSFKVESSKDFQDNTEQN